MFLFCGDYDARNVELWNLEGSQEEAEAGSQRKQKVQASKGQRVAGRQEGKLSHVFLAKVERSRKKQKVWKRETDDGTTRTSASRREKKNHREVRSAGHREVRKELAWEHADRSCLQRFFFLTNPNLTRKECMQSR